MFWTRMTIFTEKTLMTNFEPLISRNMVLIMLSICISIRTSMMLKAFSGGSRNAFDPHHFQHHSPYFCGTERFISTIECTVNIEIFHLHFIVWCQYTYRLNAELFKSSDKRHSKKHLRPALAWSDLQSNPNIFPGFIPFCGILLNFTKFQDFLRFSWWTLIFQVFQVEWKPSLWTISDHIYFVR